jgi:hypothetical protein
MAATGELYERELKGLLSGDEKTITKMVKTCSPTETIAYKSLMDNPFLVTRAAGSLGIDLVALRWDFSFPIEVKSSSEDVMHFSKNARLIDQANDMLTECTQSHLVPIYAYRLKSFRGDPWRVFTIPTEHIFKGRNAILFRRVPKFEVSSNGNFIMRWENGMKLSELISYVGMSEYSAGD